MFDSSLTLDGAFTALRTANPSKTVARTRAGVYVRTSDGRGWQCIVTERAPGLLAVAEPGDNTLVFEDAPFRKLMKPEVFEAAA